MARPGAPGRVRPAIAGRLAACALAVGCGRTDAAPVGWTPPASPELLEVYQPAEGGAVLELRYTGLGAPFRAAIADPALLEPLGAAVAGCADGARALVATWDEASRQGRLVLSVASAGLRCRGAVGRDGVDLLPLDPVLHALGTWRSGLAASHDGRLAAFTLGLHVDDARGGVTLWRASDDRIERCVVLDGRERCDADGTTAHLSLDTAQPRLEELLGRR